MNIEAAKLKFTELRPLELCYVAKSKDGQNTPLGSFVVYNGGHNIIFARTINLLTKEILETEILNDLLEEGYEDLVEAFNQHYSPDFIQDDCITIAIEELYRICSKKDENVISDPGLFDGQYSEKYGRCVFCANCEGLFMADGTWITANQ